MSSPSSPALKSNVIGLLGATTLGVVFLSPAMTLYGLFGPIFLACGKAAPLAFIFALLATLPTAFSYALLSRDYPTSGSAADWTAHAMGHRTGVWAGWLVLLYYFTNFAIQPAALCMFFNDLLAPLQWTSPLGRNAGAILGVVFGCGWPALMVYRGISISAKSALAVLLVEIGIVVALCATVIVMAPSHGTALTLDGFSLAAAHDPSSLFKAMVFGMLAFCGFDVVSTVAEETHMARKLIPRATILSLVFYAVLIVVGMWALTHGGTTELLKAVAEGGRMPINEVAQTFWGKGSLLVTITGISASLGLGVVTSVGASRILFANARRDAAPQAFARLDTTYQVPKNALHLIFVAGVAGTLIVFYCLGSFKAFEWWCTTSTFFAMMTYLFVNLAVILLNRDKIKASVTGLLIFALVPSLGIIADLYIVVQSFFIEQWAQEGPTGKSVVIFDVACALVALMLAFTARMGDAKR